MSYATFAEILAQLLSRAVLGAVEHSDKPDRPASAPRFLLTDSALFLIALPRSALPGREEPRRGRFRAESS
jgi:hypothetical protein